MTGATSRAVTVYPSGEPEFTPDFKWGSFYSSFMCILPVIVIIRIGGSNGSRRKKFFCLEKEDVFYYL
jgi:hypothetical protein